MRSKSRHCAVVAAAALILLPSIPVAVAGGFGGGPMGGPPAPMARPGIGVGAFAPGQGPVGASGWNGGNWRGYTPAIGTFWGGGYSGGGESGGEAVLRGGSANVFTYNHYDQRRRDGGFYGGNGVFYGDDGYSRQTPPASAAKCEDADADADRNPHIIRLSESAYPHARRQPRR